MKKILLALTVSGILSMTSSVSAQTTPERYQLQEVLIMKRHNLRAPLGNYGGVLDKSSPHTWPGWSTPDGELTTKGGVLEVYMGRYTRQWMEQQKLVKAGECPAPETVYIYANSMQRTVATAQFFTAGAFPGCNFSIHHRKKIGTMDPVFKYVITDKSLKFNRQAIQAITKIRSETQLGDSYKLMEQVLDYKDSPACKGKQQCSLNQGEDSFNIAYNQEPSAAGPLGNSGAFADVFILQYYEGFPPDQLGWGRIQTDEQWQTLSKVKSTYHDSLFTSPAVAKNVAAPLVKYLNKALNTNQPGKRKITVLVGHDNNIASLLAALDFKPYKLHNQYEHTPIGGGIVFQRWHDNQDNRDLMKIEYVYQSREQIRNGEPLTPANPAQRVTLELNGCPTDANGFCPMDTFKKVMREAAQ